MLKSPAPSVASRGGEAPISRIAILTGLTRKEVQRLLTNPEARDTTSEEQYNRAARVIGGWLKDPAFVAEVATSAE
jgi:hypothetical protein